MKKNYYSYENGENIRIYEESWYVFDGELYPSVTFILGVLPNTGLIKFYKEHGIYSDEISEYAMNVGSLFHRIVEDLLRNGKIDYRDYDNSQYFIPAWLRMKNFWNFYTTFLNKFKIIDIEKSVFNQEFGFAGTLDLICELEEDIISNKKVKFEKGTIHIFDWKSSKAIYDSYKMQISAYAKCYDNVDYSHIVIFPEIPRTKQGYSLSTLDKDKMNNYYDDFLFVKRYFDRKEIKPKVLDIPISYEIF